MHGQRTGCKPIAGSFRGVAGKSNIKQRVLLNHNIMSGWSELSLCSRCELYGQIVHFTNQNACGERKEKKK